MFGYKWFLVFRTVSQWSCYLEGLRKRCLFKAVYICGSEILMILIFKEVYYFWDSVVCSVLPRAGLGPSEKIFWDLKIEVE